ncbi:MAG TPA: DNA polymerase I [Verrucomicrobiae bacterium]|nr:DNA polymerase I [Verrucomicrobiae bacterium]
MPKRLFLLDGMALVYRAHFALVARPIFTSRGVNSSALYGFTQTLLEIIKNQQPTHLAVAMDTEAPTPRHVAYPEYKATRQVMPEDLSAALPHVRRMLEAFRVPVLVCDGYEADDIIGTLVRRAEKEGFQSYMVTPDKDFGQLVDENTFLYKPSRMGEGVEIMGLPEIRARWGVQRPEQVVDVLALMGDSSDNIPGVPGIGEKTAIKLIGEFGSVENLLARAGELKGRLKETVQTHREQAVLSKKLVTILYDAPCSKDLEALKIQPYDEPALKSLFVEFEFNSIGRRLFGEDFAAGRGLQSKAAPSTEIATAMPRAIGEAETGPAPVRHAGTGSANLKNLNNVPHQYHTVSTTAERSKLLRRLQSKSSISFRVQAAGADPKEAVFTGIAFCIEPHEGWYVPLPAKAAAAAGVLDEFRPVLESNDIEKVGHNLKFDLSVLKWRGISVHGKLFDAMIAHSLMEPDMRHGLDYLSEACLGYALSKPAGDVKQEELSLGDVAPDQSADLAVEKADIALQLRSVLEPLLAEKSQERVFYEIEAPLIPVLVQMEHEGIRVDSAALAEFGAQLSKEMDLAEKTICQMAGREFNLNSPRQLGEVLFEILKICEDPKKTKTGQYATDEQTLMALAPDHDIVRRFLEYRGAAKLKSTYADALPAAIWPATGRIHTTYNQVMTTTGRLNSQNPNLQNIPIRTERGQEIRKAFVARGEGFVLLSADYSQIELRIIAALSREPGLLEAFEAGLDIHTATAARVYGVALEAVTPEMRRKAKMVNYGIAYGISAFGLAQRLNIPRREGAEIIDQYFKQFSGIRKYMDETIAFARKNGYVETITGRRRYLRDIRSSNNTIRAAAERNAINAPIQGSAADMIKIAMIRIHEEFKRQDFRSRMLLQVHDELVFDLFEAEGKKVLPAVEHHMKSAIKLDVPIVVDMGTGKTWLDAH